MTIKIYEAIFTTPEGSKTEPYRFPMNKDADIADAVEFAKEQAKLSLPNDYRLTSIKEAESAIGC